MTKIDVFSGFLGAGKTTLIKKLLKEAYAGLKVVLIENEFGEIGIDGGFMKEAGIQVTEMNSGCICCSLVGDFGTALREVMERFHPDRILIEPSGVGKLSDVDAAVRKLEGGDWKPGVKITVADAVRAKMYLKNFGEFYRDQVAAADLIVLSRTQGISEAKLEACLALLREIHPDAAIVTTPWDELDGKQILSAAMESGNWQKALLETVIDDDDECDDPDCECHHHHDDDEEEHEHHHHHHDDDDDDDDEHEHHHAHEHHHHHHHHGHDADEVFTSWGVETARKYTDEEIENALNALNDEAGCGAVLRSKGIVAAADGGWIHFDFVPGEQSVRRGSAEVTGRVVVIGAELKEEKLRELFGGI